MRRCGGMGEWGRKLAAFRDRLGWVPFKVLLVIAVAVVAVAAARGMGAAQVPDVTGR